MKTKIIDLTTRTELFPDKVPLSELRAVWNDKNRPYTDEELQRIQSWLYVLAEVVVRVVERRKQQAKVPSIPKADENTQSHHLHPGEHRRAS